MRPTSPYGFPPGGLPPQDSLLSDRAVFTEAYAVLPRGVLRDIVTSALPHWSGMRLWVLARPMSGFATTFSQYLVELAPARRRARARHARARRRRHRVGAVRRGGHAASGRRRGASASSARGGMPICRSDLPWTLANARGVAADGSGGCRSGRRRGVAAWVAATGRRDRAASSARFHWVRKAYERVDGLDVPDAFVANERDAVPLAMPDTDGRWTTTRFADPADLRHDMHVNIVTFEPGALIPFLETHVMEHGLYVLEGQAVYRLNRDWVEVQAGRLHVAAGVLPPGLLRGRSGALFRYLLYKDVNRHVPMRGR